LEEEITLKDEGKYKNALDVPPCASGVQNNEKNHCIQHTHATHMTPGAWHIRLWKKHLNDVFFHVGLGNKPIFSTKTQLKT